MTRLISQLWRCVLLPLGLLSLGWVARGEHVARAQDTGTPPPRRILAPVVDYLPAFDLDEARSTPHEQHTREGLEWVCEVMFGEPASSQPPALPSDCREPLHGRTKDGGDGPENDTIEQTRGEL